MDRIVLKPFGGLSNRILAINATISLSNYLKIGPPLVIWERNNELNARFDSLFEINKNLLIKEVNSFHWLKPETYFQVFNTFPPSHYKYPIINRILGRERRFNLIYYNHPKELVYPDINLLRSLGMDQTVYIAGHFEYFKIASFLELEPAKLIRDKVDEISIRFNDKTIGLHMRRNDHTQSICMSPDAVFVKKIHEILEQKDHSLFLATDCLKTKTKMKNLFGNQIITNKNDVLERNTLEGMMNAVTDFYCLTKTRKIYGSFQSTFGYTAAKVGRINFEELKLN